MIRGRYRCGAIKKNGEQCSRFVHKPGSLCFAHDPDHVAERSRAASIAAQSKNRVKITKELKEIQGFGFELAQLVANGKLSSEITRKMTSIIGLLNCSLRALQMQREELHELANLKDIDLEALDIPGLRNTVAGLLERLERVEEQEQARAAYLAELQEEAGRLGLGQELETVFSAIGVP